jgi:hypothetical protein
MGADIAQKDQIRDKWSSLTEGVIFANTANFSDVINARQVVIVWYRWDRYL